MTFEEFFKKKKIDLPALQKAKAGLFSEFERHFNQMGEKSFDHTKKYWFNKLRREFPLPLEIKNEKVHIANPLAEQTITESLLEEGLAKPATPKPGFTPRFKASAPKLEEEKPAEPAVQPPPVVAKPGFTPRFKAATPPKPVEENINAIESTEQAAPAAPKPGFTPSFKASTPPIPAEEKTELAEPTEQPPVSASKPGFTPRFKASAPPKKVEEAAEEKSVENTEPEKTDTPAPSAEQTSPQPYKPRFKPQMLPKKPEE